MDKPKVNYTTKSGYTVTLDDPRQLVVKRGLKCIAGGWIKHNGQRVQLVVTVDDKPELARQVADFQAAWSASLSTPKPEARGNGWCEKCQSYCYGDCGA